MLDAVRLYLRYAAISIRGQLQYPASYLLQTLGHLAVTGIEFLGIWALFERFGSLAGWRLGEAALFYGLADVTFAIGDSLSRGLDSVGSLVKSGEFDRLLLRPRSPILQLLGQELTLKRAGRLAQGCAVLLWASHAAGIDWSAAKLVLLAAAIAGGVCLFLGLFVLQATTAFWTTETLEIWNAFTYGGNYASQYPLPIFPAWFRRVLTFAVPLACVNYLPAIAILGRPDPLGTPAFATWIAPLAGPAFFALTLVVWRFGVRRYLSTGS